MKPNKEPQVDIDANKVIDNLLEDIKNLHRENAILKAQLEDTYSQLLKEVRKED